MTEELKQSAPRNHGPIQETDLYDFAGWLTTRPGVMSVGRSCEVGPLSEAVAEYIKAYPQRFALTAAHPAQAESDEAFLPRRLAATQKLKQLGYHYDAAQGHWLPTQPAAQADSMGMPTSCGKPLCLPDEHHPLCKLHKPAAQATPEPVGAPISVAAVATVRGGKLSWLIEGGIADLPSGAVLLVADSPITDDCGSGEVYTHPAPGVPEVHKIDVGFRWDGDAQQHIPSMVIEFEPVKAGDPTDAKGWRDRDALAAMLAAAQAKGGGNG